MSRVGQIRVPFAGARHLPAGVQLDQFPRVLPTQTLDALELALPTFRELIFPVDPTLPVNVTTDEHGVPAFLISGTRDYLRRFRNFPARIRGVPILFEIRERFQRHTQEGYYACHSALS